ncbi:hypothetical protein [Paenibacillus tianmuensis]|uniref:hypothetical protein n=1 Tax=Paenibacillus tianmuensis TaxID=624147 RepID=UPI000B85A1C7|nr:hypothetical protein [Paenibacillus tianmuensis]
MKNVFKSLTSILLLAFLLIFFTSGTTLAQHSDNFKFNIKGGGLAETSSGDQFVLSLNKPTINLHFGLILDSIDSPSSLPLKVKVSLTSEDSPEFKEKTITFTKVGKASYSANYTGVIDSGDYLVSIRIPEDYVRIAGNGFVYYEYQ